MTKPTQPWPAWWEWEVELSSHVLKRMIDRNFSELDLRAMMETAVALTEDVEPGRWIVETQHESRPWQIIVEPDDEDEVLVVVTAYPVEAA